jgi:valyl-tRNA synthetase
MAPLAAPALEAVRAGRIRILPDRWNAVYVNWMEGIRDWNISRQIWWGHRIPVWRCEDCSAEKAYREDPTACHACGSQKLVQDPDVLDTWFSSWLWPFSTLGWPEEDTLDQRAFYPTDTLVTAPEILFFWVARMIMAGLYTKKQEPFQTVYLTGTVRDMEHRKMSKSLGNGIDPLDVVQKFGADALRYTLLQGMGLGVDVMLDPTDLEKSFAPGRNFATKLWNIGRFLLMQVGTDAVTPLSSLDPAALTRADRWILDRLAVAIAECDTALGPVRPDHGVWPEALRNSGMRLDAYAESARRFVWNELADWYVEAAKARLQDGGPGRETARAVLVHVFDQALRLLHPAMPFITESLWQRLPGRGSDELLARAAWPVAAAAPVGGAEFDLVREVIAGVRQLRSDAAIPPGQPITVHLAGGTDAQRAIIRDDAALVHRMTRATVAEGAPAEGPATHAVLASGLELTLPLAGLVDLEKEKAKLATDLAGLTKQLDALRGRLSNEKFTGKAPPELVEAERAKERDWSARQEQLTAKLKALG